MVRKKIHVHKIKGNFLNLIYIYIYIYNWVQVTLSVTLRNITPFNIFF